MRNPGTHGERAPGLGLSGTRKAFGADPCHITLAHYQTTNAGGCTRPFARASSGLPRDERPRVWLRLSLAPCTPTFPVGNRQQYLIHFA